MTRWRRRCGGRSPPAACPSEPASPPRSSAPAGWAARPRDPAPAASPTPPTRRLLVIPGARPGRSPGCEQPPPTCQPHHILPRSQGGRTCLNNLLMLCTFHHLIAVHRWGWGIVLLPDGTVTATSPDGRRILRTHSPPAHAA